MAFPVQQAPAPHVHEAVKQEAMNFVLDHDADTTPPYAVTDLLRTYLRQSRGAAFAPIGAGRREQPDTNAEELWDYLGDFA